MSKLELYIHDVEFYALVYTHIMEYQHPSFELIMVSHTGYCEEKTQPYDSNHFQLSIAATTT